jgi:tRNA(Ile)-lysidine synthase
VTGVQAAARAARYRLLGEWCRDAGVLHLLLGHQLDDQAETVALRRARHSGADGLAAMAPVREIAGLRLLRPLLAVPKARLAATLARAGQPWLEDPGNLSAAFARGRLRREAGLDAARLARRATMAAAARAARDRRAAAWLAAHARIDPAGFVTLPRVTLATASPALRRRVLEQVLMCVGGRSYPPRRARLSGLLEQFGAGLSGGRTLAGCRIVEGDGVVLICREAAVIAEVAPLIAGVPVLWDGRFRLELNGAVPGLTVRALAGNGLRRLAVAGWPPPRRAVPAPVRPGLPAVWAADELVAVPHLGLVRPDLAAHARIEARFRPPSVLAGAPFGGAGTVASTTLLRPGACLC